MGHVVDVDRVLAIVRPLRERLALRMFHPSRPFQNQPMSSQNAPDGGWRDPHQPEVAATVRELSMRAIDIAPALEQLKDRAHLLGSEPMHRAAAGPLIVQTGGVAPPVW